MLKRLIVICITTACIIFANGVGIIDGEIGLYLRVLSSEVDVTVNNQVAIVTTTQKFLNQTLQNQTVKYAFPLAEAASAIGLRWEIDGIWYQAIIEPAPQDTTIPGGGEMHPNLESYLGETPLFFEIEQAIHADSTITVEMTYVELLEYEFGDVYFSYPNDYHLIQTMILDTQEFRLSLNSERTIDDIQLTSHNADTVTNTGHTAYVHAITYESSASTDYYLYYTLSLDELGLYSLSTFLPDSVVPDLYGGGFFLFIAEPDPSDTTQVIDKVFTLIIDRSGSMSGNKIVQARDAASFIVTHLNAGDMFNIVDFSSSITSFQPNHVSYPEHEASALSYIDGIGASGSTNISGAFSEAIPQFVGTTGETANIIIFFTDGQATVGITNTGALLSHVTSLIEENEVEVSIFTFGIGSSLDEQLLSLLATQNSGVAAFLGNDELEERITEFYLMIRSPVLLNPVMTFSAPIINETYPDPLPNLYQGQQLIVAGRYTEAFPINVNFVGEAFGQPVEYDYELSLSDSSNEQYQFLTKVWAKKKIEHLLIQYYGLDPDSPEAEAIKAEVIAISVAYGVISPFTSFIGGDPVHIDESDEFISSIIPQKIKLLGNYPNPFNNSTSIRISVDFDLNKIIRINIYNSLGQLVRVLLINVDGPGIYEVKWDGRFDDGRFAPSGHYIYVVDFGEGLLAGEMTLLK